MRKIIAVLCLLVIGLNTSCNNPEELVEPNIVEEIVNSTAELNNCKLIFEVDSTTNMLILSADYDSYDEIPCGKILLDVYESLRQKGISYDYYKVKFESEFVLELSIEEMKIVFQKMKFFNNHIELINSRNFHSFYNLIVEQTRKQVEYKRYIKKFDDLTEGDYIEFEGFEIKMYNSDDYRHIAFRNSNGKNTVRILFSFEEYSNQIYGVAVADRE
jgi:hypothetical protein